jgi:O-antigen/teichoic acid export membrane protein
VVSAFAVVSSALPVVSGAAVVSAGFPEATSQERSKNVKHKRIARMERYDFIQFKILSFGICFG